MKSANLMQRYRVPAILCLLFYLNLQFQWHQWRLYIMPMPPVTFLGFTDRGSFYNSNFGSSTTYVSGEDEKGRFAGVVEFRLDSVNGGATTGDLGVLSVCWGPVCRVIAASYRAWTGDSLYPGSTVTQFAREENGLLVMYVHGPCVSCITYPRNVRWAWPRQQARELVIFTPGAPPVIIRGTPKAGEPAMDYRAVLGRACVQQGIQPCPIPGSVP
jgi:hypothetical protein